jgi:hypothetical protein
MKFVKIALFLIFACSCKAFCSPVTPNEQEVTTIKQEQEELSASLLNKENQDWPSYLERMPESAITPAIIDFAWMQAKQPRRDTETTIRYGIAAEVLSRFNRRIRDNLALSVPWRDYVIGDIMHHTYALNESRQFLAQGYLERAIGAPISSLSPTDRRAATRMSAEVDAWFLQLASARRKLQLVLKEDPTDSEALQFKEIFFQYEKWSGLKQAPMDRFVPRGYKTDPPIPTPINSFDPVG